MPNFYDDNADLRFYVEKYLDWPTLVELTEYGFRAKDGVESVEEGLEFYTSVLDMVGKFVANEVAPHAAQIDLEHPKIENGNVSFPPVLDNIFTQMAELELHGMCVPRELGGMNCPFVLFLMITELMARAEVSVAAHFGFHGGMALAMLVLSIMEESTTFDTENVCIAETRFGDYMSEIMAGEAWGSMDITEPGAGSDMGALQCRGEVDADGQWYVNGQKIFITSGHAKYHFVIARTEETDAADAFAGLQGLSMFLVKAYDENAQGEREYYAHFDGLEEKLGHHGSATVAVSYDRTPAHLIGKRGDGFKLMLLLMNNARVGVGFESLGLCEAAWRMAKAYAAERQSMGKTLDKHEIIAEYLDEMETDIQGIRALAMAGGYHEETQRKLAILMNVVPPEEEVDRKRYLAEAARHAKESRRLTPLVKFLGAEKAVEITRRNIQIHGGFGYSMEYGAEKLLRDAMVLPIYEGTSQIQALMATKDSLMGVLKDPMGFLKRSLGAAWQSRFAPAPERRVGKLDRRIYGILRILMRRIVAAKFAAVRQHPLGQWGAQFKEWDPKRDFALALLHAERLTQMLADAAIAHELLEQAERFPERRDVLERYLERAETRSAHLYHVIKSTGPRLLATLANEEESA